NARELAGHLRRDGLEIRVGFELSPMIDLGEVDPSRLRLDGYDAVLIECPFEAGAAHGVERIFAAAEIVLGAGLLPILAHPERSPALITAPHAAGEAARRGWLLQITAASLVGRYGGAISGFAWSL